MKIRHKEDHRMVLENVNPAYFNNKTTPAAYVDGDGRAYSVSVWEKVPEFVDRDVTSESRIHEDGSLFHDDVDGVRFLRVDRINNYRLEKVTCWEIPEHELSKFMHVPGRCSLVSKLEYVGAKKVTCLKLFKRDKA